MLTYVYIPVFFVSRRRRNEYVRMVGVACLTGIAEAIMDGRIEPQGEIHNALFNLYMAVDADYFIGMLGSSWARMTLLLSYGAPCMMRITTILMPLRLTYNGVRCVGCLLILFFCHFQYLIDDTFSLCVWILQPGKCHQFVYFLRN